LLADLEVIATYESIRRWRQKFRLGYARKLKKRQGRLGDTWHIDEVFVQIQGQSQYLYRAVDQDGDIIDILVQLRCNQQAVDWFFRCLLIGQGSNPRWLVTDNSEAMPLRIEGCDQPCTTKIMSMRITKSQSRTNRHGNESERCENFLHRLRHNHS